MNKADKEIEIIAWMHKQGYDRKASKDIAPIIADYLRQHSANTLVSGSLPLADYAKKLSKEFKKLRFDKNFHLGMGDIRLSIGMQEDIINEVFGGNDR